MGFVASFVMSVGSALWAFDGREYGDLTLSKGDKIECIFETDHPEWYIGTVVRKGRAETGIFPARYVEMEDAEEEVFPIPLRGVAESSFEVETCAWSASLSAEQRGKLLHSFLLVQSPNSTV